MFPMGHTLDEKNADEKKEISVDSTEDVGSGIDLEKELYNNLAIDPVLAKKMALVNNAFDEIGMTPFQWKLFFLNGFGYAVDSVCINHNKASNGHMLTCLASVSPELGSASSGLS